MLGCPRCVCDRRRVAARMGRGCRAVRHAAVSRPAGRPSALDEPEQAQQDDDQDDGHDQPDDAVRSAIHGRSPHCEYGGSATAPPRVARLRRSVDTPSGGVALAVNRSACKTAAARRSGSGTTAAMGGRVKRSPTCNRRVTPLKQGTSIVCVTDAALWTSRFPFPRPPRSVRGVPALPPGWLPRVDPAECRRGRRLPAQDHRWSLRSGRSRRPCPRGQHPRGRRGGSPPAAARSSSPSPGCHRAGAAAGPGCRRSRPRGPRVGRPPW